MAEPTGLDARWKALAARDGNADGSFVYAVTSTGIYCRPSCPSRRPRADRVRFFDTGGEARREGFRPCKRCKPDIVDVGVPGMEAVRRVSAYLSAHADEPVTLASLGRVAAMSPHHLQRRFKALVGVSPREFQAACRADRLRASLRRGDDVTTAIYVAGYGSPSRVYEGGATRAMAPSVYRKGGAGMQVAYSVVGSPFGRLLVATTDNGVCAVKLGDSDEQLARDLRERVCRGRHPRGRAGPRRNGSAPSSSTFGASCRRWICRSTSGPRRSSGRCGGRCRRSRTARPAATPTSPAPSAGRRAARAVARACATNPVCLVVPCHRVVQSDGGLGGYRYGVERKKKLLAREARGK